MTANKKLDIAEFRELGLLQEVNRRFFHPIGLALAVNVPEPDDEIQEESLAYIIDSRDDPEGFMFAKMNVGEAAGRASYYDHEVAARLEMRSILFGPHINMWGWQPLSSVNREVPSNETMGEAGG